MTDITHKTVRIGHSPDPDDAFMWYPLANFPDGSGPGGKTYTPRIDTRGFDFIHVLEDIQSLNVRSEKGELEITAISIHQYPYVAEKYILTSCGSSMGDGYGPMLVSPNEHDLRDFITPIDTPTDEKSNRPRIAIPGDRTTAWLTFQLLMKEQGVEPGADRALNVVNVPFDEIIPRVKAGEFEAGLIIHEGQLTYKESGLRCLVDLGEWWTQTRGVPLPLGGNAIRRDMADDIPAITTVLLESIKYALSHREESVEYALNYARDMGADLADRFVGMYVNDWTLDYGETGRKAVRQLLQEAGDAGICPALDEVDFADPE